MGWLISLGEIIWGGIQAASTAVVAYLSWAVNALFWLGQVAYNALVDLASVSLRGIKAAWGFFHWTYDNILAPAWRKFWKFVDTVRSTLEHVLKPVFDVLRRVRDEVLAIYNKVVRPVLDTIELTRQGLRVLEALHVGWAQKLDAKLGDVEAAIERPFRLLLEKINEAINLVNRVVTADGLFQRLALVRSLERDIEYVHREFLNAWHRPLTATESTTATAAVAAKSVDDVARDVRDYLETSDGADAALISEQVSQGRIYMRAAAARLV